MLELIAIHVPKTAGHSFEGLLRTNYGTDNVARFNINKSGPKQMLGKRSKAYQGQQLCEVIPPEARVLHGHFRVKHILPILAEQSLPVVAWVRDPVERVISNYFYVQRQIKDGHRDDKFEIEDKSLLDFARKKSNRNQMTKIFKGLSVDDFYFLGILEYFDDDIRDLGTMLGWTTFAAERKNTTDRIRAKNRDVTLEEREEIRQLNPADVEIYKRALQLRAARRARLGENVLSPTLEQYAGQRTMVFFHLPKTGGTTLGQILRRQFNPHESFRVDRANREEFLKQPAEEKAKLRLLEGHQKFGIHELMPLPCDYVTVLRDPVDRVISEYYHALLSKEHKMYHIITDRKLDLLGYARSNIKKSWNDQTRRISGGGLSLEEDGDYTLPADALDVAKENLRDHFKVVGVLDMFDETLLVLKKMFGWRDVSYFVENVTPNRPPIEKISPEVIAAIREKNKLDTELVEFSRNLLQEKIAAYGPTFTRDLRDLQKMNRVRSGEEGLLARIIQLCNRKMTGLKRRTTNLWRMR